MARISLDFQLNSTKHIFFSPGDIMCKESILKLVLYFSIGLERLKDLAGRFRQDLQDVMDFDFERHCS